MIIAILFLLGLVASAFGTIIGAGGGFLFVPILLLFYDISPEVAAATGLAVVFINAVAGLPMMIKQRRISFRLGLLLSVGAVPGTFLGAWLVRYSPDMVFYLLFSALLMGLGLFLLVKKQKGRVVQEEVAATVEYSYSGVLAHVVENKEEEQVEEGVTTRKLLLIGGVLGVLSSFFGVGGGWLLVPILVYGFHILMNKATATSMFALALYSLIGLLPAVIQSQVDWFVVCWSSVGILIGAQLGAYVSNRLKGTTITKLLASVVIIMGISMIFQI